MLITPRTYSASQTPDHGIRTYNTTEVAPYFSTFGGWKQPIHREVPSVDMLLIHQTGSVRVGEVVRYTLTYTPAADPILPLPSELYVRIKNTSAIPLRAAYLHGPYTLYTACYPSTFDPNAKYDRQDTEGVPQFEPYLKAGGSWDATIKMPVRFGDSHSLAAGQTEEGDDRTMTWVIEIVSQVIFSTTAAVHFELLVARDANSIEYFSSGGSGSGSHGPPGKLQDHWDKHNARGHSATVTRGVYSKSTTLRVDDTSSLWNTPPLPSWASERVDGPPERADRISQDEIPESTQLAKGKAERKKKKIHLVVVTHGLHSNLGADMLYMKESIDAAAAKKKQAKQQARQKDGESGNENHDDDDDEEIIVRGFSGNAARTERGIQYLGKRLAKYVLLMTYPDQPFYPLKLSRNNSFTRAFSPRKEQSQSPQSHPPPESHEADSESDDHAYQVSSISFIAHSLGGLVQTYAIAYIQKHSPEFFDRIQPVNFIALASPFLGLSNENPLYVRFALDLGLVGRTGQDLGLTWTPPKVRSGWGAIIGGRGDSGHDQNQNDPGSKPLLRILPSGPAHAALKKFHHRTVYSNVVNDGIVPLRTSCLLFLDWRGLGRVEKARRGNGLVGTMAEWGWAELTGANSKSPRLTRPDDVPRMGEGQEPTKKTSSESEETGALRDGVMSDSQGEPTSPRPEQFLARRKSSRFGDNADAGRGIESSNNTGNNHGPLASLMAFFRPKESKPPQHHRKHAKIYKRSQTLANVDSDDSLSPTVRGNSFYEDENAGVNTPPKTTFFESAGDLLMPPLPPPEFILDPSARPRTIFHDRVYHPEDIPRPLPVKHRTFPFSSNSSKHNPSPSSKTTDIPSSPTSSSSTKGEESGLKLEEKIARAYHRDLTWRKVLVRLEPDAHNNIIVRRMFTNAYGWPVVKHLVDTHFGPSSQVEVDDTLKSHEERAKALNVGPTSSGEEVEGQSDVSSEGEGEREDGSSESDDDKASPSMDEVLQLQGLADALLEGSDSREAVGLQSSAHSSPTSASRTTLAR
ncbi:Uncharacterized protein PECH_000570 [Penicillium ucsense]|uniref:DUF676 domain-containing protein n=1 Tax=Penicillium ucsense TaxID=2839758 RepID=A0A8J8WFW3_9EURO|nr:Uncharacterized protein PECM_000943 [Penicillium ucsense]KAF7733469.1 Uncharacterized protein PECH_000570 [Penicillium ucsense]